MAAFNLVSVLPIATRTIRVAFSDEPLNVSDIGAGDVYNPYNWVVTTDLAAEFPYRFTVLEILATSDPAIWDVVLLQALRSNSWTHRVSCPLIVEPDFTPMTDPTELDFPGVLSTAQVDANARAVDRRFAMQDLANPPFALPTEVGGTLKVGPGGDYANETGQKLLKKLIIRRLITPKGAFFHLPGYGVGLNAKTPLPQGDVVKLKKDIETQILAESEVQAVAVAVSYRGQNEYDIFIKAKLKTPGDPVAVTLSQSQQGLVVL